MTRTDRQPQRLLAGVLVIALALTVLAVGIASAQSSCGNAFLEPPEECDPPGSITCPPGSPAGAFLPCNPDCTCPTVPTTTSTVTTTVAPMTSTTTTVVSSTTTTTQCVPTGPENTSATCSDMIDNDCNGLTDCQDPSCTAISPCPPARKDPTVIKFGPGGAPDVMRGHAKLDMAPVDITTMSVGILLSNTRGPIYSGSLTAGALTPSASGTVFRYSNPDARTSGGIYALKIKRNRTPNYTFSFTTYADLSAATDPLMRLQFYIGEDPNAARDGRIFITNDDPWRRLPNGWKAPRDH